MSDAKLVSQPANPEYDFDPQPSTLDQLRNKCGRYGPAVADFAIATCLRRWACKGLNRAGNATRNIDSLIHVSLDLHVAQLWRDIGVQQARAALCDLSPPIRGDAERVVAETLAEWRAAGSPGLGQDTIRDAYRFVHGFIWSGELEAFPGAMGCRVYSTTLLVKKDEYEPTDA
jgi:hypothetical protein